MPSALRTVPPEVSAKKSAGAPCTHQFLDTLTVQTTKIKPTTRPTPCRQSQRRFKTPWSSPPETLNTYIPPGTPWNNGYIESFNNRLRRECLNRNRWTSLLEARVVVGDFKHDHNHRHRHSALGYLTPAEYSARCSHTHHPVACEIN